jgi:hypothetical protein
VCSDIEENTKCWVVEERDLSAMYDSFNDGSKITLWCDGRTENADAGRSEGESAPKKRKTDTQDVPSLSVTADDDEVYKKLKSKHPDMTNPKFLSCKRTPQVVKRIRRAVCQMHWLTQQWLLHRHVDHPM